MSEAPEVSLREMKGFLDRQCHTISQLDSDGGVFVRKVSAAREKSEIKQLYHHAKYVLQGQESQESQSSESGTSSTDSTHLERRLTNATRDFPPGQVVRVFGTNDETLNGREGVIETGPKLAPLGTKITCLVRFVPEDLGGAGGGGEDRLVRINVKRLERAGDRSQPPRPPRPDPRPSPSPPPRGYSTDTSNHDRHHRPIPDPSPAPKKVTNTELERWCAENTGNIFTITGLQNPKIQKLNGQSVLLRGHVYSLTDGHLRCEVELLTPTTTPHTGDTRRIKRENLVGQYVCNVRTGEPNCEVLTIDTYNDDSLSVYDSSNCDGDCVTPDEPVDNGPRMTVDRCVEVYGNRRATVRALRAAHAAGDAEEIARVQACRSLDGFT